MCSKCVMWLLPSTQNQRHLTEPPGTRRRMITAINITQTNGVFTVCDRKWKWSLNRHDVIGCFSWLNESFKPHMVHISVRARTLKCCSLFEFEWRKTESYSICLHMQRTLIWYFFLFLPFTILVVYYTYMLNLVWSLAYSIQHYSLWVWISGCRVPQKPTFLSLSYLYFHML